MNQSESPPVSGLVAGKYQLVRMIGRGGMGSVWEARHASLGTPVAIKFIEPEYADSTEAKSRFEREAKAAAAIQSKHAIQIHDHGIQEGRPFIVMELLQGTPLDKRLEGGPLSLQETARIIQQVCRGLGRAHERGIVHRDLKPENIFLVHDEDGEIAKVLDFGIAKLSNNPHNPSVTSSTKTGAVLGTPFYMSPEQARGLRNVDHRTDIWSLGVIAYKCVTGKLPFDGESVGDLLVKICTAPIPRPTELRPDLPESFNHWFHKCLEREPDRRYASVMELAAGLAAAAGLASPSSYGNAPSFSSGATMPRQPPGSFSTPQPQVGSQPGYSATPQPGALTASPFTSSQRIPGVPTSRWKPIVGLAVGMAFLGGGGAAGFYMLKARGAPPGSGVGVVAVTPPPPASAPAPPVTDDKDEDKDDDDEKTTAEKPAGETPTQISTSATPPSTTTTSTAVAAKPTPPKPVRPVTKPATQDKPDKTDKPSTPPPPPPPPTKRPPRTDPGY